MDEPTAALTETEIEELFTLIRQLRANGVGIVHISHRLEELKQISDRVTVMRDGRTIDTLETKDADIDHIISLMVGRTIYESAPELPHTRYRLPVRGPQTLWPGSWHGCQGEHRHGGNEEIHEQVGAGGFQTGGSSWPGDGEKTRHQNA
jgi:energy-coupling factor transporter ATP-binding protein EcfA2